MQPWLRQLLQDIKAQRAYREFPAEIKDRVESGLAQPTAEQAAAEAEQPLAPPACLICGGVGCVKCNSKLVGHTPQKPDALSRLDILKRDAPHDLAAGRRLLLTKHGLSAKQLAIETGIFTAQHKRCEDILHAFHNDIVKVARGRYCFKQVDRDPSAPKYQGG